MRILRVGFDLLTSTRIGLGVMVVLAVLSLLGATIPQGGARQAYIDAYGGLRGDVIWRLGLSDVFHAAYFTVLVILLCMMVFACSLRRLPRQVRLARQRELIFDDKLIGEMPYTAELILDVDQEEARLHVLDVCKRRFYSVCHAPCERGDAVFASKAAISRYGSFVLHLSFIFLLVGGVAGMRFGSRYYEGVRVGKHFELDGRGGETVAVTVEDFTIEFDDREQVSDYVCEVTFRDAREGLAWYKIRPNHPLRYMGNEVYLVSYEEDRTAPEGFVVSVYDSTGAIVLPHFFASVNSPVYVEEVGATIKATHGVVPSLTLVSDDGAVETSIIKHDLSEAGEENGRYCFVLVHSVPSVVVTLEVVREPGQGFIIGGLVLLTLGTFVSLYLSHRRIWFIVSPLPGAKARVVFGGRTSRNREGFAKEFEAIRETLDELS